VLRRAYCRCRDALLLRDVLYGAAFAVYAPASVRRSKIKKNQKSYG
jgi:hypothetical protein